jgi:hypothetical protein
VAYLRYQDDFIIFCKTRRQLQRAKQRMMAVLKERQLTLSRKKSRIGALEEGFHFLGFDYQPTRRADTITVTRASDAAIALATAAQEAVAEFVQATGAPTEDHVLGPVRIVPHSRTLRKGRVQVRQRVLEGCSTRQIRRYLHRFLLWWVNTSGSWQYYELGAWFVTACGDINTAAYAATLLAEHFNPLHTNQIHGAGWGR